MTGGEIPPFREGQRVEFGALLERYPHFTIPAGATGVVDYVDSSLLSVRMDELVPGLEAWENHVDFQPEDFAHAVEILRVHADR